MFIENVIFMNTKYIFCFEKSQLKTQTPHLYVVQYNFHNKETILNICEDICELDMSPLTLTSKGYAKKKMCILFLHL